MRKGLIGFLLFTSVSLQLTAQPYVEIADLQYQVFSKVGYKDHSRGKTSATGLKASLTLPLELGNDSYFIIGADHSSYYLDYDSDSSYKTQLYSTGVPLGVILPLKNDRWNFTFLAIPRLASGFDDMAGKNLQIGGMALVSCTLYDGCRIKAGLYYNREFFGNFWMPLLGCDWKISDKLYLFGVLPGTMNVQYEFNPRWASSVVWNCITASFRSKDHDNRYYARQGDKFWGEYQLSYKMHYYPVKNLAVYVGAGLVSYRYFQLFDENNEEVGQAGALGKMRDPSVVYFGIAYRVRHPE